MNKKIFISNIILFIIILILLTSTAYASDVEVVVENHSVLTEQKYNLDNIFDAIENCKEKMDAAHQMAEAARILGYQETDIIILIAQDHWWEYHDAYIEYKNEYHQLELERQLVAQKKQDEYPVAYEVWMLLKEAGYNDYVCAGIIGNMMIECGGSTLNLRYDAYNPSGYYYGLCQWNRSAYGEVFDEDIEGQVDFLLNTIQYEFDVYGYAYKAEFNYEQFLNLENEKDVALAFAKCYERCDSSSYSNRQSCATIAYEYFIN